MAEEVEEKQKEIEDAESVIQIKVNEQVQIVREEIEAVI